MDKTAPVKFARTRPPLSFSAPGRVNLIGEHTDYTGGFVLPMAIPFETVATLRPAFDGQYRFTSELFGESFSMAPGDRGGKRGTWTDYPVGVLRQLQSMGLELQPFELELAGNVPLGAGLSSSASVEVATALALLHFAGHPLAGGAVATLCQRAENVYVGSPCGIMDQFVSANAVEGHALLLNTRNLSYELLPMNEGRLAGCVVVVVNSGVRHSIAEGDYGLRRRELESGQRALAQRFPHLRDLGDATLNDLAAVREEVTAESFRRCRHVICENARTLEARAAMLAGDPVKLGAAMTESHRSQRDDFACSVPEIDFLVDQALRLPGCHGARLTGGGFGGCTVNLVDATAAEAFSARLRAVYAERWGFEPATYTCAAVDGAVARASKGPALNARPLGRMLRQGVSA